MTKIYAQGNYIVIEANNERKTFQKKGVGFEIVNYDGLYSLNDNGLPMGDFNYSEVKKQDGSGYATPLEFETFYIVILLFYNYEIRSLCYECTIQIRTVYRYTCIFLEM